MKRIVLSISGMTCSACSSGLEKYLKKQEGIKDASVNLILAIATIDYEGINIAKIENYIKEAGFASLGEFKGLDTIGSKRDEKKYLIPLGLLIIFIMYATMGHMLNLPMIPYLNMHHPYILGIFLLFVSLIFIIYGFDIIKSGLKNLYHLLPNMDTLVGLSVLVSFAYSIYGLINIFLGHSEFIHELYFESTCMIIYFIKLGRYIENLSKDHTKDAIQRLVTITPKNAIILKDGKRCTVTIDEVSEGDTLVCLPGEKIAVDGKVTKGHSYVDESFITGESIPVLKDAKSKVIAGSINYDGYLEYKAERIGKASTISEIVNLVVEATNTKSRIEHLADKICSYFVPIVIGIAILTFIVNLIIGNALNTSIIRMVTVMLVACPCSLGLAVPLVSVTSNGLCASKGLFLRNGETLEHARKSNTLVCDKTGTLTYGKLSIYKVYNYSKYSDKELLDIVANIESHSSHPISKAFKINKELEVLNFKEEAGLGISGKIHKHEYYLANAKILKKLHLQEKDEALKLSEVGCSIIYVIEDKKIIGLIGIRDIIRDNIKKTIKEFKDLGIDVYMLTGDNEVTSKVITKEIGIDNVISNVRPKDKEKIISELMNEGKHVIMVGDGINDAPALVSADIGISISDGTDIAYYSSDVILMNNNLHNILDLINISKRAYKIIKENLFWAFIYNIIMIPIAAGLLSNIGINMSPMFGSIAMIISSLTVVLNSLRLRRE